MYMYVENTKPKYALVLHGFVHVFFLVREEKVQKGVNSRMILFCSGSFRTMHSKVDQICSPLSRANFVHLSGTHPLFPNRQHNSWPIWVTTFLAPAERGCSV